MLRLLALVLLLANGLYFAWGNGLLLAYGLGPAQQGEPQHMAQQIAPASIKLLKPEEFKQLEEQVKAEREPKIHRWPGAASRRPASVFFCACAGPDRAVCTPVSSRKICAENGLR